MTAASQTTQIKVLFFGRLKEITGCREALAHIPPDASLDQVFTHCCEKYSNLAPFRAAVVACRNQEFVAWNTLVRAGDEIAFLPPVSGG